MLLSFFIYIAFHAFRSLVHFSSDLEGLVSRFFTDFMSVYTHLVTRQILSLFMLSYAILIF